MNSIKSKLLLLMLTLLLCSPAALSQQTIQNENVPAEWKKVNAEGMFTFHMPPNAWLAFQGLDEYSREWRIGKMAFMFVFEPMGVSRYDIREKIFGSGYQESTVEIDGRRGYLINYFQIIRGRKWYSTALFVGDWPNNDVKLQMRADSTRLRDLEVAKKIFRTVKFLKP